MNAEIQLIIWGLGILITMLGTIFGLIKWVVNIFVEKVDNISKRFDENTDKVLTKFDTITDKMSNGFRENIEDHSSIKITVVELAAKINQHIGASNGKSFTNID
jgi:hypothetical protein